MHWLRKDARDTGPTEFGWNDTSVGNSGFEPEPEGGSFQARVEAHPFCWSKLFIRAVARLRKPCLAVAESKVQIFATKPHSFEHSRSIWYHLKVHGIDTFEKATYIGCAVLEKAAAPTRSVVGFVFNRSGWWWKVHSFLFSKINMVPHVMRRIQSSSRASCW